MRLTASEARRLPAKAGTQNEKQNVAKLLLTCLCFIMYFKERRQLVGKIAEAI